MSKSLTSRIDALERDTESKAHQPIWFELQAAWMVDACISRFSHAPLKDEQGRHWLDLSAHHE